MGLSSEGDINVENPPKRTILPHFHDFFSKLELFYKWKSLWLYMRLWDVKRFLENFAVLILPGPSQNFKVSRRLKPRFAGGVDQ